MAIPLEQISKLISSTTRRVQKPSDASTERSWRDSYKTTVFVVRSPVGLEEILSDINSRGGAIFVFYSKSIGGLVFSLSSPIITNVL